MKKLIWTGALLLCSVAAAAQAPKPKTFVSKEGHFSVRLPERPVYSTEKADTEDVSGPNHVFLVDKKETAYYVSFTDFKPEVIKATDPAKLLDGARDGGVGKGKLLGETKITLDGNPGREITVDTPGDPKTIFRARFYLVDNRLITLIFAGPPAVTKSAATDSFFASLKLMSPKTLPDAWTPVRSPEGNFSIKMPGKPEASVDDAGKKSAVHLWQFTAEKDGISYLIAYNDTEAVPEKLEDFETALDAGRDAVVKSLSATVIEENLLSVDGNPGRELHMRVGMKGAPDESTVFFRGFFVKGRYYQVMALGTKAGMEKGHVEDFMDSFQLLETVPDKK